MRHRCNTVACVRPSHLEAVKPKANPSHAAAAKARWAANNPESVRAIRMNRRARIKNAPGTHSGDEIRQMYEDQGGVCAYCEAPLNGVFEVEHMVPLAKGGGNGWDNIAITCKTCNKKKNAMTTVQFFTWRGLLEAATLPQERPKPDASRREQATVGEVEKVAVNYRLTPEVLAMLEDVAGRLGIAKTAVVEIAIREYAGRVKGKG